MILCIPLMVINLVVAWIWLQLLFLPLPCFSRKKSIENTEDKEQPETNVSDNIKDLLLSRYNELGPMSRHEKSVLCMFLLLVILWMTRSPGFVTGWEVLLPAGISDATPAIFISLLMFIIPIDNQVGRDIDMLDKNFREFF